MIDVSESRQRGENLISEIERRSGMRISCCYQCGRCTSTCTGAPAFDMPPHRIMRMLQLGRVEEVLTSATAQLCFDCMTCSLRCPMNIDMASVIETVKMLADERGLKDTEKGIRFFRREFLKNVRRHGRLHEPSLVAHINLRSGRPFNDLPLMLRVLTRKKIHMVPPKVKNLRHLRGLFKQIETGRRDG